MSHLIWIYAFDIQFSTLHLNLFPSDSLLKNKADNKCRLKFGTERVKDLCSNVVWIFAPKELRNFVL